MINAEKERRPEQATARRTEGDRRRRQALADHASGHAPHEGETPLPSGSEQFRAGFPQVMDAGSPRARQAERC